MFTWFEALYPEGYRQAITVVGTRVGDSAPYRSVPSSDFWREVAEATVNLSPTLPHLLERDDTTFGAMHGPAGSHEPPR